MLADSVHVLITLPNTLKMMVSYSILTLYISLISLLTLSRPISTDMRVNKFYVLHPNRLRHIYQYTEKQSTLSNSETNNRIFKVHPDLNMFLSIFQQKYYGVL